MINFHNINGELSPASEACIGVMDIGFLRGYGIFDYFLFKEGKPLFFDDYLSRFINSSKKLYLDLPVSRKELKKRIINLIEVNEQEEGSIRLVLTGGYSENGFLPGSPNLLILQHPVFKRDKEWYEKGIKLMLCNFERQFPEVKATNYVPAIQAIPVLNEKGANDVLYYKGRWVSESARSNFFIVDKNETIITPARGILKGITRGQIITIARKHFKVEERDLHLEELKTAREAFISNTSMGVMPVVQIDHMQVGNGHPGSVTMELLSLFRKRVEAYLKKVK